MPKTLARGQGMAWRRKRAFIRGVNADEGVGVKVLVLGASNTEQNFYFGGSNGAGYGSHGWMQWARTFAGDRFQFEAFKDMTAGAVRGGAVVATAGYTSQQILDTLVPVAIARAPDLVIVENGGNDTGLTDEEAINLDIAIEQALLSAGLEVWRMPISPRVDGTQQQLDRATAMEARCAADPRMTFVDWRIPIAAPGDPEGEPNPDNVYDGRHLNTTGGFRVGAFLAPLLIERFPALLSGGDNVFVNPDCLGTGGVVTGPTVVGAAAASLRAYRQSSRVGGATAVASIVARDGERNWSQLVMTASGEADTDAFQVQQYLSASSLIPLMFPVGTWCVMEVDCEVDVGSGGLTAVGAVAATNGGTTRTYIGCNPGASLGTVPNEAWSGRVFTPPFQVLDDTTSLTFQGRATIKNDVVGVSTVRFGGFRLRAVFDPRITWPGGPA